MNAYEEKLNSLFVINSFISLTHKLHIKAFLIGLHFSFINISLKMHFRINDDNSTPFNHELFFFFFSYIHTIRDIRWMLESQFNEYFSTVKVLSDHEIMDDEELNIDEVCLFVEKYTYLLHMYSIYVEIQSSNICVFCVHMNKE
jgi:hypothetical protein